MAPPFDGTDAGRPDGYALACEAWARAWRPSRPPSVSEWAARYRRLSAKSSAEPGPWRNDRIPYLAGIMDALGLDDPAPLVVFVASSQVGKSECGLNWIGRAVHVAPGSFLALFPSEKDARKWVRSRLNPLIAETPELRRLVPLGRRVDSGNTLLEKHFPGGVLFTGSANIPSDVAAISVPFRLLDEVDRMPATLEHEGDPIELSERRSAAFVRRKGFMTSTPTTVEGSRIWPYWLRSTMGRYVVPCVHCGHRQALRWSGLKWPAGKPHAAEYACEECGGMIPERHKSDMLAAGEWRHEHADRALDVKGFHVNGLYTPAGLGDSWGMHAAAWERSQGSPAKLQVFHNTRLGEPVTTERQVVEWEAIKARAEPYRLRTIPRGVLVLTSGTDVQHDRLETQIVGFGRDERATVVDYVVHYGDPTRGEVWAALDAYLATPIANACGVEMRVACSLVDAGFMQHEVTNWTRARRARRIFAAKGSTALGRNPIGKPSHVDVRIGGETQKRGAELYVLGVGQIKATLYRRLRADEGTPDAPVLPGDRHFRFSSELPDDYFRQLAAEVFDPRHGWVKRYDRNEALDTAVLAIAAAMHHAIGVHRFREADWARLAETLEPADGAKKAAAPVLGVDPVAQAGGGFIPTAAKVRR